MVKNTQGGNKHKGQARKHVISNKQANKLRVAEEEGEIYAQVVKMLGNGMCHVTTNKGVLYLCIIRGKFRGRGKRDNLIKNGTWILVGLRDFESEKKGEMAKCDLLEVYSDSDKDRLKNTVDENWKLFIDNDFNNTFVEKDDAAYEFSNNDQEEYRKLMNENKSNEVLNMNIKTNKNSEDEDETNSNSNTNDEINIDDI